MITQRLQDIADSMRREVDAKPIAYAYRELGGGMTCVFFRNGEHRRLTFRHVLHFPDAGEVVEFAPAFGAPVDCAPRFEAPNAKKGRHSFSVSFEWRDEVLEAVA